MINSEKNADFRACLTQVADNLKLIAASDAVTPLERDLALQLLREAYLIVMNPDVAQPEPVVEVKPVAQPEPVVEAKPIAQPEPVVEVKPVAQPEPKESHPMDDDILDFLGAPSTPIFPQEPAPAPKAEPVRAPQPAPVEEPQPQHTEPASQPAPAPAVTRVEPQPRPKSPSTLFSEPTPAPTPARKETKTLHDILAQTHEDNSLATKFQHSHIDDLSKAITLNDKFIYIRELFRNKGEEFGQAIQKLNNCQNIDEAFSEIDMMKKFYMWDTTSTAYLSLCDLVRRKFV